MRWRKVTFVDEYFDAGEAVVMLGDGRVMALTALPTAVLGLLAQVATTDELAAGLNSGEDPLMEGHSMEELVQVLEQMSGSGLIRAV